MSKISFYVEQSLYELLDKLFKNKNRIIKHTVNQFFDNYCKLFFEPEGVLPYFIKGNNGTLQGALKYNFGIYPQPLKARRFIYIEEKEGTLLQTIVNSSSQLEFLALTYLLNAELNLGYNAFVNNNVDLIVNFDGQYKELSIEYAYSARLSDVFYEDFIREYLTTKSKSEKIAFLREHIEKQIAE